MIFHVYYWMKMYFSIISKQIMARAFIFFFLIISNSIFGQKKAFNGFLIDYSYQFPLGQLAETFSNNSAIGINLINKKENNFFYGLKAAYIFGGNIKDNTIFDNINTENGFVIDGNGTFANIILLQEGFSTNIFGGYAIHLNESNPSGVYFSAGIGFLQHRIRIDTKNQYIPHLNSDYKKGYDQLTNGINTNFVVDYVYFENKKRLKVYTGFDYSLAFTKNRRAYNLSEMSINENKLRLDQLLGIHFGIIIPINRKNNEEFHYF